MRAMTHIKNVRNIIMVTIFGVILLGIAYWLEGFTTLSVGSLFPSDFIKHSMWFAPIIQIVFILIISLISFLIYKLKLSDTFKAIYLIVPLTVAYLIIGVCLEKWIILMYIICTVLFIGIIAYLYIKKKSWIYYYSVILVSLALLIMSIID